MATFDLSKVRYRVIAILSDGQQLGLDEIAENIAWEENENELAVRLNLTIRDMDLGGKRIADVLALCTAVYLYADWGEGQTEVFRGTIWEWQHSQVHNDEIVITCYDMLFYLQKSKDFMYFTKGTSTKSIISKILSMWNVSIGGYDGPNVTHEKTVYKSKTIASMLIETLDDAKKLGGGKSFIRASGGLVYVIGYGSNDTIYSFTTDANLIQISDTYSMTSLVTNVLVLGKEDKEGRPPVKASIAGQTEYGVLQDIVTIGSLTLKEAKTKAQDILDEKGEPKRTIKITSVDFPAVRKGEMIHIATDRLQGYFCIKGVSHNATSMTMQMEVEPA